MKVAFWGAKRKCGVTSNLLAVSACSIMAYPIKISIFENHYDDNGIRKMLFTESVSQVVAENERYDLKAGDYGRLIGKKNHKNVYDLGGVHAVEVKQDRLFYVPQHPVRRDIFEEAFVFSYLPQINRYSSKTELAFTDVKHGSCMSSNILLDSADCVVVNLEQNLSDIQYFFQNYSSIKRKSFFIIGNYKEKNTVNLRHIISEFDIPVDCIGVIPYNQNFAYACEYGQGLEYVTRCFHGNRTEEEAMFAAELKKTTYKLLQQVVFNA